MRPDTEEAVADAIKSATGPLAIRGGGTRRIGVQSAGVVLETGGLDGITLYDPGALTLVVRAGTPLAKVEKALAAEGQCLPFEPMDHRGLLGTSGTPTIGGVVAGNISGPRRIQSGACRDVMLGVRFVDGAGTVLSNGGRVMKNVTGYDLVKLMTGSWGTLGVLTEVSMKVLPRAAAQGTVLIEGLDDRSAQNVMSAAMGSPYDVSGAAHARRGPDGSPVTMLRVEGFEEQVRYRTEALGTQFAAHSVRIERDFDASAALWTWVRDVAPMQNAAGDVWKISTRPTDAPALVARLNARQVLYDWAGGLIWALMPEGSDLRMQLGAFQGHATLIRGSDTTRRAVPVFHPEPAAVARLSSGIRARFDPRGILNPGLMAA